METTNEQKKDEEFAQPQASTQSAHSKGETNDPEFEQQQKVAQAILKKLQDKKLEEQKRRSY